MQKRLKIKVLTTISLIFLSIILLFIYSKVKKAEDEDEQKNTLGQLHI